MAISASTVWEIRVTGSDSNGGGYVATGTDYSQQAAAQVTIDNSAIVCSTPAANSNTLTFVSGYTPSAADIGNIVQISAGTNINTGFYQITGQSSTTWTLTGAANLTTATAGGSAITGAMGGALASPGKCAAAAVNGNTAYIQYSASVYSITSASTNIAGGCLSPASNTAWIGYQSTRAANNTDANRPTLQIAAAVSSATIFTISTYAIIQQLILDGNSQTSSRGTLTRGVLSRLKGINFTNTAFSDNGTERRYFCEATGCTTQPAFSGGWNFYCESHGNTANGFAGTTPMCYGCLSWGNTGGSTNGFNSGEFINCVADRNGAAGFSAGTNADQSITNCIATNNTGPGFQGSTSGGRAVLQGCFAYNNSVASNNSVAGTVTALSGDPFTASVSGNFSSISSGAGLTIRAAGLPGTFPAGNSVSYQDAGAVQHQDSGGSTTNLFVLLD
jgi:hypothetical protein